jgi:hypothetical protein
MSEIRRSASGAREAGDDYQHLVAWNRALRSLLPGRRMIAIELEAIGAGNVDDVVVRYDQPPHEFTQVRFAVDASTPLNSSYLLQTAAPGGTSMLQKFHASWRQLRGETEPRMQLITNRAVATTDSFLTKIDGITARLMPIAGQATSTSTIGKTRAAWAAHLHVDEEELLQLLGCLHFRVGRPYEAEAEHAADLMLAAGMRNGISAIRLGVDRMRRWVLEGRRKLPADEVEAGIDGLDLRAADPAATLLIQAIVRDPLPEDATEALDWVDLFQGDEPWTRRKTRDADAYRQVMHPQLQEAADRLIAAGYRRVVVRGAMRLATWLAAGHALAEVRGVQLVCGHRGQPWSSDDTPRMTNIDASIAARLGQGDDLAVALAIAAEPIEDVIAFARATQLPVDAVGRVALPGGPHIARIADGGHAVGVVHGIRDEMRRLLRETAARRIHLFLATPAGLALLLGHRWNRIAPTVVYEDLSLDGYQPAYDIMA